MSIVNLGSLATNDGKESARGIASLVVAIAHAYGIFIYPFFGPDYYFGKLLGVASHQAVMIFFVISGYLITLSIIINIKKNNGEFNFVKYISSRIARIYPPLIFSVTLSFFFLGIIKVFNLNGADQSLPFEIGEFEGSRKIFLITFEDIKNVVMMRNGMLNVNGPLWSLYVEWRIYIVAGVLALLIASKKVTLKIIVSLIFVYAVYALLFVNEHAFFYILVWFLGAAPILAPSIKRLILYKYRFLVATFLIVVIFSWTIFSPTILFSGGNKFTLADNLYQLLICIVWCLFIIPDRSKKFVRLDIFLVYLGNLSYSLYILHFPIMLFISSIFHQWIKNSLSHSILVAAVSLLSALAISRQSSKIFEDKVYFEKPIYKIIRNFILISRELGHKLRLIFKFN